MGALLQATGLRAYYRSVEVLHGIDLAVEEGGVTALLGANGAGKTTTLRALCGMVRRSGEIRFRGEPIGGRATEDIARRGLAHVPEGRGTFTGLTVEENLRIGAHATRAGKAAVNTDMERMYGYFPRLAERRRQQAGTLSGGEQQMLAVARALMSRPVLLVLDEPSLGVAPLIVQEIFAILARVRSADRVSILLVEQNAALALSFADHAYLLQTGQVVLGGNCDELQRDERVRRAYLGE